MGTVTETAPETGLESTLELDCATLSTREEVSPCTTMSPP